MAYHYSDRIAIITGGTGGVGGRVTERWIEAGASVLAVGARQATASDLPNYDPARFAYLAADLATEAGARAMAETATRRFGRSADTLIHLVGAFGMARVDSDEAPAVWDKMLALNLTAAFHCYRAMLPGFKELGQGWIAGLGARAALQPGAQIAAYAASKAGLIALTQSLAAEVIAGNVHVNLILTSTVDTPANRSAMGDKSAAKWVTPDDIADATFYLCSDAAKSVSGATLEVYGRA